MDVENENSLSVVSKKTENSPKGPLGLIFVHSSILLFVKRVFARILWRSCFASIKPNQHFIILSRFILFNSCTMVSTLSPCGFLFFLLFLLFCTLEYVRPWWVKFWKGLFFVVTDPLYNLCRGHHLRHKELYHLSWWFYALLLVFFWFVCLGFLHFLFFFCWCCFLLSFYHFFAFFVDFNHFFFLYFLFLSFFFSGNGVQQGDWWDHPFLLLVCVKSVEC